MPIKRRSQKIKKKTEIVSEIVGGCFAPDSLDFNLSRDVSDNLFRPLREMFLTFIYIQS